MPIAANAQFGIPCGQLMPSTSFSQMVPGLTTCKYVWVRPLTTNTGNIVFTQRVGNQTPGMLLEPTDPALLMYLGWDNSSILVKATLNGCTVFYHGTVDAGE